jgi:T4 bacteriophage base plate protein
MPLPKIDLPIFELKLVSLPKPVKFRPFLVKEEKLLLMALQSNDEDSIFKTIKQVINNCLVEDVDIDKLPIFDIEYLFLNVRARSVGEKVETVFICRNVVGKETNENGLEIDVECKHLMQVGINVLDIKPPNDDVPTKVYVTDKIGLQLRFPTLRSFKSIESVIANPDNSAVFDMIYDCTEYVFDENGMYYVKESAKEEFVSFLESLTQEQFDKIAAFFENLPKIQYDVDTKCTKCEFDHKLHLEGLNDFFI